MVLLDVLIVGNWARASSPGASAMPCAVAAAALASGRVVGPAAKRTRLRPLSAISQALALRHMSQVEAGFRQVFGAGGAGRCRVTARPRYK